MENHQSSSKHEHNGSHQKATSNFFSSCKNHFSAFLSNIANFFQNMDEKTIQVNQKQVSLVTIILIVLLLLDIISLNLPYITFSIMGEAQTLSSMSYFQLSSSFSIILLFIIGFLFFKKDYKKTFLLSAVNCVIAIRNITILKQTGVRHLQELGIDANYTETFINKMIHIRYGAFFHIILSVCILAFVFIQIKNELNNNK